MRKQAKLGLFSLRKFDCNFRKLLIGDLSMAYLFLLLICCVFIALSGAAFIPASDPNIQYIGRVDKSTSLYQFDWYGFGSGGQRLIFYLGIVYISLPHL